MRQKTETISFRAEQDLLRAIDQQRKYFDISRGAWTRGIVITWLNQIHQTEQQEPNASSQLEEILIVLERVIRNQEKALFLELTSIGSISVEAARAIVLRHLTSDKGIIA